MKKLIRTLVALTFLSTPVTSVVACGKKEKNTGSNNEKTLTDLQNDMLDGASFLSKMILSGRHENLNYNVNEILSMYLTPIPTALMMPVNYKFNNEDINFTTKLNKYKSLLAPSINKINNDNYSGIFTSYVMGMYDNDFYNNFLKNGYFEDSFNQTGGKGFNKKSDNELGILAGFDKDLKLSEEENRKNLAWAIQDTGALTNYLLDKGYDGSYPGDTNGTSSPKSSSNDKKGGTNGSGYLYYNSVVSKGKGSYNANKIKKELKDKIDETNVFEKANITKKDYSSKINGLSFNKTGSMIANTAGNLNVQGYINNFSSIIDAVSESDFGAEALLNVSNYMTPLLIKKGDTSYTMMQLIATSMIQNIQNVIKDIQENEDFKLFLKNKGFDENTLNITFSKFDEIGAGDFGIPGFIEPKYNKAKITRLYDRDENSEVSPLDNLKNVSKFLNELAKLQKSLTNEEDINKLLVELYTGEDSIFNDSYGLIINGALTIKGIGQESWVKLVGKKAEGATNLLSLLSNVYNDLSKNETKELLLSVSNNEIYNNKAISDLSRTEKMKLIKELGYDYNEKTYTENSFFKNYYNSLKDTNKEGVKEINDLFKYLKEGLNDAMNEVHNKALQYIYDDKYWKTSNVTLNATDPSELNAKMEFTLEYNGIGDAESNADLQTTKIDVPNNFNPYQTKLSHQEDYLKNEELNSQVDKNKVSGKVLGKEKLNLDDNGLINYDGKGEKYKNVKHKYNIVWQNISNSSDNPYWVIVDVKSYNENGEEFYNIY
ncbi:hypothetical protein [Spiroplasma turonicum]|uniref:Lipoprotein n=1 Tax=Spiroplasma turonicum TaxID=216946 RepID=A0A0K1P7Z4_9MOLU|nr:hypothetical protein [Spiroplasma turonicum]AKU79992.1 hypothetical protein STURON_00746 [Spiroplasma turonicum]ALX70994.1 hypothetical protein STURO_v1c07430 [Spiroplasma turonicum]